MRIGKFANNEPTIRFVLNLVCTDCGKKVPGGMLSSKKYFGTYSFLLEIDELKKKYLCGKCRDKKRLNKI
jgi:hypothetical protein